MIGPIYTAGTGMEASQVLLDVTSNNLANLNTPGFKAGQVSFQEVLSSAGGQVRPGVTVAGTSKSSVPGPFQATGNSPSTSPTGVPGQAVTGFVEGSNVNPVMELTNLLLAKHAHAANSRAVITADRMSAEAVSLDR